MKMKIKTVNTIILLSLLLAVSAGWGMLAGSVKLSLNELLLEENRTIVLLRALRVMTGILAGCGLGVSGAALQAILRNPLAEPYLLGTSSGAGLGAVIAIVIGASGAYLPIFAFIGAIASTVLVYNLARQNNKIPQQSLILSGVIVSVSLSAIIVFLISLSSDQALHGMAWWLWGNLQVYDGKLLFFAGLAVFTGTAFIYAFSQDLNAISIGEEEATHLGINAERVKKLVLLIASFTTASIVSLTGIIGFVGLIIPHMMRMIIGPNHKNLIPATCAGAAIFMVACDTISRTIFSPLEIPIGVITAIVGAPVFMTLLRKSYK